MTKHKPKHTPAPKRYYLLPSDLPDVFPKGDLRWINAYVLLDLIARKANTKRTTRCDGLRFVSLKHRYIRNQLPKKCHCLIAKVWRRLRRLNIIDTIGADQGKGQCMLFALTPEYSQGFVRRQLPEGIDWNAIEETEKAYDRLRTTELPDKTHKWIESVMEDALTLDSDAELHAATVFPNEDRKWSDVPYRQQQLMAVCAVQSGCVPPIVCKYGRVHTPVTYLHKRFRPYLRLDDEPVVELDVSACQPLLLFGLVRDWIRMLPHHRKRFCGREFELTKDRYLFRKDMRKGPCNAEDVEQGVRLCETGEFYTYMGKRTGISSVAAVKGYTLEMLFKPTGCLRASYRHKDGRRVEVDPHLVKLWTTFKKDFPTAAEMMVAVKKDDYRRLSWILQNAESTVMIDGVCKQIMKASPKTPIVPIHDAILCKPSDRDFVRSVMQDEFAKRHLNPTIK